MTPDYQAILPLKPKADKMVWAGWIVSALPLLMMLGMGIAIRIFKPEMLTDGMVKYGYPERYAMRIFWVEMICAVIYLIPQTAVLGAILLTGYLGGATATHVRAGEPFFMPVLFGILVWLGLYLRDSRVRALVPLRRLKSCLAEMK